MKTNIYSILIASALVFAFALPLTASACGYMMSNCNGYYDDYGYNSYYGGGYNNYQQYQIPQYVYYQDPSYLYNQPYRPVQYPIPLYVQTAQNPANYNHKTHQYSVPQYGYNTPIINNPVYGSGFTITSGSYAGPYGAYSGGFINTSGR